MDHPNDPLHGVTLKVILEDLVARHGWEGLADRVAVRCFEREPSIRSSLKFLRKTEWARAKVERLYLADHRAIERKRKRNAERAERRASRAVLRSVLGVLQGADGQQLLALSCGHQRDLSRDPIPPPDDEQPGGPGGDTVLGRVVCCAPCLRLDLPEGFVVTRRTDTFDNDTVPKGLLASHTTKQGVWGQIHVETGTLRYRIHAPYALDQVLTAGEVGVIPAEIPHEVALDGPTRFAVEFWAAKPVEIVD